MPESDAARRRREVAECMDELRAAVANDGPQSEVGRLLARKLIALRKQHALEIKHETQRMQLRARGGGALRARVPPNTAAAEPDAARRRREVADVMDELRSAVANEGRESELGRLLARKLIALRKQHALEIKHETQRMQLRARGGANGPPPMLPHPPAAAAVAESDAVRRQREIDEVMAELRAAVANEGPESELGRLLARKLIALRKQHAVEIKHETQRMQLRQLPGAASLPAVTPAAPAAAAPTPAAPVRTTASRGAVG